MTNTGGGLVIEGFISDLAGPHTIKITKAFPIGKIDSIRATPFSAEKVSVLDQRGNEEVLTEVRAGIYQTSPGFKGVANNYYRLRVEFKDASVFESVADTLIESGNLDSVYVLFSEKQDESLRPQFSFDVFADATLPKIPGRYYSWSMIATYKVITDPTCIIDVPCNFNFQRSVCNFLPLCSGLVNVGTNRFPRFERQGECTCCMCWYGLFNNRPTLNNEIALDDVVGLKVGTLPINSFTFMFKMHLEVQQRTLSKNTYRFWKRVIEQKEGAVSLFQPVTGQVQSNFRLISGKPISISGIFYATSVKRKAFYITREQIPNLDDIAPKLSVICKNCLQFQPNSTSRKPSFWID